jgi:hypothetical protein
MSKKARTPIIEYDDSFAIELAGKRSPQERDRLSDQAMVVAYDRQPGRLLRWRLRALHFDRDEWTRSAIRRWWAAHEVQFLRTDQLDQPVPEICRVYHAPDSSLPTIILGHRNTPLVPARQQIEALKRGNQKRGPKHHSHGQVE